MMSQLVHTLKNYTLYTFTAELRESYYECVGGLLTG